jgi:hypothetical protein
MSDIYDLEFKTSYVSGAPNVSSLLFGVPQASFPDTNLLSYNSVAAPASVGTTISTTSVNITRSVSTYTISCIAGVSTLAILQNAIQVATNPGVLNTNIVTNKTFQPDYKLTFNFDALTSGIGPTLTPPNITGQINILVNGSTQGFITNSPNNSITLSLPAGIIFTFTEVRSGGLVNVSLIIQSLIAPSSLPVTYPLFSVPDTYGAAQLGLLIFQCDITYVPINLNDVSVTITFPPGGLTVTSNPITTPHDNDDPIVINTVLTFVGSRDLLNYFDFTGFNFVNVPEGGELVIHNGSTNYDVPSVPPPQPILVSIEPFCIHPNAMVSTNKGMVRLGDIKSKWNLLIEDYKGNFVPFIHNIKFGGSSKFVRFEIGSLGKNKPSRPLLLTEGHPILIDGKEHTSKSLINKINITLVEEPVDKTYCLATSERTFVNIDGVFVCTWHLPELEKFAKEKGIYYQIV